MAQTYIINNKRYQFGNIDSSITNAYTLVEADHNKWLKLDTTNDDIDITLPLNISEGFRVILENTGQFSVNYLNEVGTTVATVQDKVTEEQYKTVEATFNSGEWRLQGYLGINDISSLYDVNVTANGNPADGDVLSYDLNTGIWQAGKVPKFIPRELIVADYILQESDHAQILPVNTNLNPVDIAINTGINPGFYCKIINVGTGTITFTTSVVFNSPVTQLTTQYSTLEIFHAGLEQYYCTTNS